MRAERVGRFPLLDQVDRHRDNGRQRQRRNPAGDHRQDIDPTVAQGLHPDRCPFCGTRSHGALFQMLTGDKWAARGAGAVVYRTARTCRNLSP